MRLVAAASIALILLTPATSASESDDDDAIASGDWVFVHFDEYEVGFFKDDNGSSEESLNKTQRILEAVQREVGHLIPVGSFVCAEEGTRSADQLAPFVSPHGDQARLSAPFSVGEDAGGDILFRTWDVFIYPEGNGPCLGPVDDP